MFEEMLYNIHHIDWKEEPGIAFRNNDLSWIAILDPVVELIPAAASAYPVQPGQSRIRLYADVIGRRDNQRGVQLDARRRAFGAK